MIRKILKRVRSSAYFAVFAFPLVILLATAIPIFNAFFYTAHNSLGFLLLPLCTPYIMVRLGIVVLRSSNKMESMRVGLILYLFFYLVSYPLISLGDFFLKWWPGVSIHDDLCHALLSFPISLLFSHDRQVLASFAFGT
jgi:hypothetical protein